MDMPTEQYFVSEEYLNALFLVAIALENGATKEQVKHISIVPPYYGSFTITEVFNELLSSLYETIIYDSYGEDYKQTIEEFLLTAELSSKGRKMVGDSYRYEELALYKIPSQDFKDFPIDCLDDDISITFGRTKDALFLCAAHEFGDPIYAKALQKIMEYHKQFRMSGVKL